MRKPIIGIMMRCEVDSENKPYQYVFDKVRSVIIKSGGEPLLLCPVKVIDYYHSKWTDFPDFSVDEKESMEYWLDMCDGLFLPGGSKFTKYDKYIVNLAIERNIPILGVCLGMQILANYNVDNDIFEINSSINHFQDEDLLYCHSVKIVKDSLLYRILGKDELAVNSFHVRSTNPSVSFKISARADDDIIEAIELSSKDFVLGVQWHPEKMIDYDSDASKIIDSFIEASRNYKLLKKDRLVEYS